MISGCSLSGWEDWPGRLVMDTARPSFWPIAWRFGGTVLEVAGWLEAGGTALEVGGWLEAGG